MCSSNWASVNATSVLHGNGYRVDVAHRSLHLSSWLQEKAHVLRLLGLESQHIDEKPVYGRTSGPTEIDQIDSALEAYQSQRADRIARQVEDAANSCKLLAYTLYRATYEAEETLGCVNAEASRPLSVATTSRRPSMTVFASINCFLPQRHSSVISNPCHQQMEMPLRSL